MRAQLFRMIVASLPLMAAVSGAKAQIIATIDRTGRYSRLPEADVLPQLLAAGQLRRATPAEVARLARNNPMFARDHVGIMPVYVMLKPIDPADLGEFSGGLARTFIVPPAVRQRDFGRTHSTFMTPTGSCLQGRCGDCGPSANGAFVSNATPDWCMVGIPAAPPAPPAPPRR